MIFKSAVGVIIFIVFVYYMKRKRKLLSALIGGISGFAALLLLNRCGGFIDYKPPLNLFNICGSSILGIPYVLTITILYFLRN